MSLKPTRRADPPRLPPDTAASFKATAAYQAEHARRAAIERAWIVRGVLLLGVVVLLASIARAGLDRAFVPGWWREW